MPVSISVIIPLYNKENNIQNTINSVLNQTYKDFEIIIVNDGSTDRSLNIVEIISDSRISIVNQENKGLSAARNKGISVAKGTIIALLDADDLWHVHFLESIYNLYLNFPEACFYGTDYLEKYSDNNIIETAKNIKKSLKHNSFLIEDFFISNKFQPIICQSSLAFKKDITKYITFDENISYAEDVDFYIKSFIKYNLAYNYNPFATILYNVPNQITNIGLKNKVLPNLDKYEEENPENTSLKKYLDFKRYMYAVQYKLIKDKVNFNKYTNNINYKNLTTKQIILLKSPIPILRFLKFIKKLLLKQNIRLTSFNN